MRSAGFNKIMDAVEKVRVLVCGDDGVGKKRLIESFTDVSERRTSTLSTIGKSLYRSHIQRIRG